MLAITTAPSTSLLTDLPQSQASFAPTGLWLDWNTRRDPPDSAGLYKPAACAICKRQFSASCQSSPNDQVVQQGVPEPI